MEGRIWKIEWRSSKEKGHSLLKYQSVPPSKGYFGSSNVPVDLEQAAAVSGGILP